MHGDPASDEDNAAYLKVRQFFSFFRLCPVCRRFFDTCRREFANEPS